MSFHHLRGSNQEIGSPDQVGRTFLRTYENQLYPFDIILVQKERKFCFYKKVFLDQSSILPAF